MIAVGSGAARAGLVRRTAHHADQATGGPTADRERPPCRVAAPAGTLTGRRLIDVTRDVRANPTVASPDDPAGRPDPASDLELDLEPGLESDSARVNRGPARIAGAGGRS